MIAQTTGKQCVPQAETGWAQAHGRRDRGVRTCVPAVLDRTGARRQERYAEDDIVRGED
ncbi:hypothetical protein ACL07V_01440 [Streptomyces sp. MB22_4]|uniref:hypothetical protein n=1 Tax=Streptomyces sp. MB22_4 TaxID=3383120 RepID=UPI0039A35D46